MRHCWARTADPPVFRTTLFSRAKYETVLTYVCKQCGATISSASKKIEAKEWQKVGIEECHIQVVKSVLGD